MYIYDGKTKYVIVMYSILFQYLYTDWYLFVTDTHQHTGFTTVVVMCVDNDNNVDNDYEVSLPVAICSYLDKPISNFPIVVREAYIDLQNQMLC